ncbi:MAG: S-layer homology domain-containing protein [Candidatus Gracilibacteria bacterium]
MNRIFKTIAWIGLLVIGAQSAFAALPPLQYDCKPYNTCILYVDDSYQGVGGGTKDAPYRSITAAMNSVQGLEDYTRIYIAGGTYDSETYPWNLGPTVGSEVRIYGGYDSTFTTRDSKQYPVNIDAAGASEVLDIDDLAGIVDGLTFYGTSSAGTGQVLDINNTGATSNNFIVSNNIFRNNNGNDSVVRVNVSGSNTAVVENNIFRNNESTSTGTALAVIGEVEARKNLLYANAMEQVFVCGLDSLAVNNYILGNSGEKVVAAVLGCSFYHNTVVDNDSLGPEPGIVYLQSGGNDVKNNILAYNSGNAPTYVHGSNDTTSVFDYNVQYNNVGDTTIEDNNIDCDPLFVNKDSTDPEDLQLGAGSDCIDAGININPNIVATDYFGTSRPADGDGLSGAQSDPGAYEALDAQIDAPVISALSVSPDPFSPNADGYQDTSTIALTISETATVSVDVIINNSKIPLIDNQIYPAGPLSVVWDGVYTDNSNNQVEASDGTYDLEIGASNGGGADDMVTSVTIDRTLEEPTEPEEPAPGEQCGGYTDVAASHPSCDAIEYVQSIGAMTGNPDGTFAPNQLLQRDQVAKISLETFGLFSDTEDYCGGNDPFPDVPPAQWSYQYICRGVDVGMITGYEAGADAGMYRPAREVNRAEFLALILRNLSDSMPADSSTSYSDVEPNQWFSGFARYSLDNDLFAGPNLMPTNGTKRVEVADVLYKLHNLGKI